MRTEGAGGQVVQGLLLLCLLVDFTTCDGILRLVLLSVPLGALYFFTNCLEKRAWCQPETPQIINAECWKPR